MMQTGGGMNCGHSVSNGFCLFTPSKLFISMFITHTYIYIYIYILSSIFAHIIMLNEI
jgi:hypothetical protein